MPQITINEYKNCTVVEIVTPSLMDPIELDRLAADLYKLVDEQDKRRLVLDFGGVQFIASQAIAILVQLHKKTSALKGGLLVMCNLSTRLLELLRITRLDKLIALKATQQEAMRHLERMSALT